MEYIKRRGSYFVTESGDNWTPIGYNESFTWDALATTPEEHLTKLAGSGINCLRIMFEYAETADGFLETKLGTFSEDVTSRLKTIFALAKKLGIRFIVSPYDTYWQWKNWEHHPYATKNGGYLDHPRTMLQDPRTLEVHKNRFRYLIENFSEDGSIFAWDLWNEIHPAYSDDTDQGMNDYITQISEFVRETETKLFGKSHLQTVSVFGPVFRQYDKLPLKDLIFQHPSLDFTSVHLYHSGTIDHPKNTVEPAYIVGVYLKDILDRLPDGRPFLDTESGPMSSFIDKGIVLDEKFDNEYFSNMCWAHLASGGAGPCMRWPYRHPHQLTDGMLATLNSVSMFCRVVNWSRFNRENITSSIVYNNQNACKIFACGTSSKFILNVLRTNCLDANGMYREEKKGLAQNVKVTIPNVIPGNYRIVSWKESTNENSIVLQESEKSKTSFDLTFMLALRRNLILYIEKI